MSNFTPAQQRNALIYLVLFHLGIIASSNYLVQLPFTVMGFHTTWGAFTFPFIFLATDLTVRIFGAQLARRIIFLVMLPALAVSYGLSVLFFEGQFQGFGHLTEFNLSSLELLSLALWLICSVRFWMSMSSIVCVNLNSGGLHRHVQRCLVML